MPVWGSDLQTGSRRGSSCLCKNYLSVTTLRRRQRPLKARQCLAYNNCADTQVLADPSLPRLGTGVHRNTPNVGEGWMQNMGNQRGALLGLKARLLAREGVKQWRPDQTQGSPCLRRTDEFSLQSSSESNSRGLRTVQQQAVDRWPQLTAWLPLVCYQTDVSIDDIRIDWYTSADCLDSSSRSARFTHYCFLKFNCKTVSAIKWQISQWYLTSLNNHWLDVCCIVFVGVHSETQLWT